MMSRLVVVSNRVPPLSSRATAGGLAIALRASLQECGGLWLGWSGRTSETSDGRAMITEDASYTLATIDLSRAELRGYYEHCANRALWPMLHGRLDLARFDDDSYAMYRDVNRKFAAALKPLLQDDDIVWVHDYHLFPLGAELRRLGVRTPLGFFLHVPFPPEQTLMALPWARQLAGQLCAYDLIGFQTAGCRGNLKDFLARQLSGSAAGDGVISVDGRIVRTGVFPIGIDTNSFSSLANSPATQNRTERLQSRFAQTQWIAGVDRLDYTKGIPQRFRAFEEMLAQNVELRGKTSLCQIAAPSRMDIAEYKAIQAETERLAGHTNGRFGDLDWTPIRYINRSLSHAQLAALYRTARVGLVTPLCDGMNLVAKEYVAAQDPSDPGVLVLSRFAGAASELTDALIVNPYDVAGMAAAIRTALYMPLEERQHRWRAMMLHLEVNDIHRWRTSFVDALRSTKTGAADAPAEHAA